MSYIPAHISALLAALRFRDNQREALHRLTDEEWRKVLHFSDMSHLTIAVGLRLKDDLPNWVRERIHQNIADNAERFRRIKMAYAELASELHTAGCEHIVLKGFAQWPAHLQDPKFRIQSDIDLYCPPALGSRAISVLSRLGYTANQWELHSPSDQHLPQMSREHDYQWKGNFFDPEIPVSVEIHSRFWNEATTRIDPGDLKQFWDRRIYRQVDELTVGTLELADCVGYSTLHAFRHLLYSSLLAFHIYEIAWFLQMTAGDRAFWSAWPDVHNNPTRTIEAIIFSMAQQCFGCELPGEAEKEVAQLDPAVQEWTRRSAPSAMYGLFRPNKDALWLHLSLLESREARGAVFRRSIMGTRVVPLAAFEESGAQSSSGSTFRQYKKYCGHVSLRLFYHGSQLPSLIRNGIRWWWSSKELSPQFWTFYSACFFFDLGMFVFFFLFNLYLLDLRFTMKFLSLVTGAMSAGSIAGTIPAAMLGRRFGLRNTLLFCFGSVAILGALRTLWVTEIPQLCLAFLGGMASCIFAVSISPALAQLTTQKNRAFGFSLVFSFGIGEGALGGLLGGSVPDWLRKIGPWTAPADLKRIALLIASFNVLLALWPASRLRFSESPSSEKKLYPRGPFLSRFLVAIGIWALVTGAFSPFFNAFFSQRFGIPIHKIGTIAAASQISQVLAILAAPLIFRKFGLVSGIVCTQVATALALAWLAAVPGASTAAIAYVAYMSFQWMSEPGMYSLLMNKVMPSERGGASALNFLVISTAQAIAALMAGASFERYGYSMVLSIVALLAIVAAAFFRFLVSDDGTSAFEESQQRLGLQAGSD